VSYLIDVKNIKPEMLFWFLLNNTSLTAEEYCTSYTHTKQTTENHHTAPASTS